jgi:uncharacterized protein
MWVERVRTGGRVFLAGVGALAVWAFFLNRVVIQWVDGPFKILTIIGLGLGLVALGAFSVNSTLGKARWFGFWMWPAVLGTFTIGEAHRAWLRASYGASSTHASLWDPVTTTDLRPRRFELEIENLGTRRIRIVHLSDLHVTNETDPSYITRVHGTIRELDPDLIFMTGDYVSAPERIPPLARWLEGLPRARYGAYAVLGNHDYWTEHADAIREVLGRAGVSVIGGTCASVVVSDAPPLRICGTEEPWGPALSPPLGNAAVSATLVLSHTPDNVYALADQGATAVFAGHTHGGQMRIPWLGPLVVPSRYGRRFDQGHFVVSAAHLYVSAGVGADAPNLRLWCPPDLLVVDLVPMG